MISIYVDLDGTIAQYDKFIAPDVIGDPIPGAKEFMDELKSKGFRIIIYTSRPNTPAQDNIAKQALIKWLQKYNIPYDGIYEGQGKPKDATIFVDDRAVSCEPQKNGSTEYKRVLQKIEERIK